MQPSLETVKINSTDEMQYALLLSLAGAHKRLFTQ